MAGVAGLAGCAPDPRASRDDDADLAEIRLSGARVAEQRTWRSDDHLAQTREWRVRVGGEQIAWSSGWTATVDDEGRIGSIDAWTPDRPAHLLEASLPALRRAAAGETLALDVVLPASQEVVVATLAPAEGGIAVEAGGLRALWRLDGDRVSAIEAGAVQVVGVDAFAPQDAPDLPGLLRLPTEPWPGAAEAVHLVVRLDGVDPADLDFPGQHVGPDGLHVDRPLRAEIPRASLTLVETLVAQVRAAIDVAPTPGRPDAERILQTGTGDCNEHAAALVALLRAEGVDARAVTGWVYADAGVEPGLYPHAWVEALLDPAGWVPVDPVLGQAIADATHVRVRDGVAVLARPVVTRVEIR